MTIQSSMVSFESGADRLDGHLALPDGSGPRPAVVVIQEIFNDHRESYREKEAHDAWAKSLAFFERHLR